MSLPAKLYNAYQLASLRKVWHGLPIDSVNKYDTMMRPQALSELAAVAIIRKFRTRPAVMCVSWQSRNKSA